MKLEFIGGPQGTQRCSDGGGHLLVAGAASIAKGTVCIADYAGTHAAAQVPAVTPTTTPGTAWYAETIMVPIAGSAAAYFVPTSLLMVAMEDGPSTAGTQMRFSEIGDVKVVAGGAIAASYDEVGIDPITGAVEAAVATDLVIGVQTGTALSATAATMYVDMSRLYIK